MSNPSKEGSKHSEIVEDTTTTANSLPVANTPDCFPAPLNPGRYSVLVLFPMDSSDANRYDREYRRAAVEAGVDNLLKVFPGTSFTHLNPTVLSVAVSLDDDSLQRLVVYLEESKVANYIIDGNFIRPALG